MELLEMNKISKSALVAQQAKTWLGTKFKHQGRLKKNNRFPGGVDCIGLIVGITRELNICDSNNNPLHKFDRTDYSREPNGNLLREIFDKFLQVEKNSEIKVGQILLIKFAKHPQHVGVVAEHPEGGFSIIHAYQPAGKVVEHRLTEIWQQKIVEIYKFKRGSF